MPALRRGSDGFTLIEIMVSMLLLAIGFLGLAAVQAKSLAETQNTQFRSKADVLLRDIADRMRANDQAVAVGSYIIDSDAVSTGEAPANCPLNLTTHNCLAQRDLVLWMNAVDDALPDPHVLIDAAGEGVHRIRIDWAEKRSHTQDVTVNPCGEDPERSCTELRVFVSVSDLAGGVAGG